MKKISKLLFVFVAAISMCVSASCIGVPAATQAQTATKYYKKFLKGKDGYYKIVNVNSSKVPELMYVDDMNIGRLYTFDSSKKKILRLKKVGGGKIYGPNVMKYNAKKHRVAFMNYNTGGADYRIYKVYSKKATRIKRYDSSNGKFEKPYYRINGKKVSQKTWNKKLKADLKGFYKVKKAI